MGTTPSDVQELIMRIWSTTLSRDGHLAAHVRRWPRFNSPDVRPSRVGLEAGSDDHLRPMLRDVVHHRADTSADPTSSLVRLDDVCRCCIDRDLSVGFSLDRAKRCTGDAEPVPFSMIRYEFTASV